MFGEGLYLRTLIVQAFTSTRRLLIVCYVIGWGSFQLFRYLVVQGRDDSVVAAVQAHGARSCMKK